MITAIMSIHNNKRKLAGILIVIASPEKPLYNTPPIVVEFFD
jgi:hypothetical protein